MSCRAILLIPLVLLLTAAALATGSPVFLFCAILPALLAVSGLAGVLWTARTLHLEAVLSSGRVQRGEQVTLRLTAGHRCPLPIAPIRLLVALPTDAEAEIISLRENRRASQSRELSFSAAHIGAYAPGVLSVQIEDLLGLFRKTLVPENCRKALLVLPVPFQVQELTYAPGDAGLGTMARASEDLTSPSDVRSYQPGDPLKRIHWKLSLQKGEVLVRKYDEPILP